MFVLKNIDHMVTCEDIAQENRAILGTNTSDGIFPTVPLLVFFSYFSFLFCQTLNIALD